MQGNMIGLIIAASLVISGCVYMFYDLNNIDKKEEADIRARGAERAEARAREGAGSGEGAGAGAGAGDSLLGNRYSIGSNDDSYSIHSGGGSRRKHRKSNKGSKGRKASKGSKGRKSRKHNNKKSKSKNSKSF